MIRQKIVFVRDNDSFSYLIQSFFMRSDSFHSQICMYPILCTYSPKIIYSTHAAEYSLDQSVHD